MRSTDGRDHPSQAVVDNSHLDPIFAHMRNLSDVTDSRMCAFQWPEAPFTANNECAVIVVTPMTLTAIDLTAARFTDRSQHCLAVAGRHSHDQFEQC